MSWESGAERLAALVRPDPIWASSMHNLFGWPSEPEECSLSLEKMIESTKHSVRVPEELHRQFEVVRNVFRFGLF